MKNLTQSHSLIPNQTLSLTKSQTSTCLPLTKNNFNQFSDNYIKESTSYHLAQNCRLYDSKTNTRSQSVQKLPMNGQTNNNTNNYQSWQNYNQNQNQNQSNMENRARSTCGNFKTHSQQQSDTCQNSKQNSNRQERIKEKIKLQMNNNSITNENYSSYANYSQQEKQDLIESQFAVKKNPDPFRSTTREMDKFLTTSQWTNHCYQTFKDNPIISDDIDRQFQSLFPDDSVQVITPEQEVMENYARKQKEIAKIRNNFSQKDFLHFKKKQMQRVPRVRIDWPDFKHNYNGYNHLVTQSVQDIQNSNEYYNKHFELEKAPPKEVYLQSRMEAFTKTTPLEQPSQRIKFMRKVKQNQETISNWKSLFMLANKQHRVHTRAYPSGIIGVDNPDNQFTRLYVGTAKENKQQAQKRMANFQRQQMIVSQNTKTNSDIQVYNQHYINKENSAYILDANANKKQLYQNQNNEDMLQWQGPHILETKRQPWFKKKINPLIKIVPYWDKKKLIVFENYPFMEKFINQHDRIFEGRDCDATKHIHNSAVIDRTLQPGQQALSKFNRDQVNQRDYNFISNIIIKKGDIL